MGPIEILGIVLGSSVIASIITAIFSRQIHNETVALKYITEERAKWRNNIKNDMHDLCAAVNLQDNSNHKLADIRKISTYIKLNLNPSEKEKIDRDIIKKLTDLCNNPNHDLFVSLENDVQRLLKHDWERAKIESKNKLTWHFCVPIAAALGWVAFNLCLKNTSIYSSLQKVPVLASNYSELALFSAIIISPFCIWGIVYPALKLWNIKRNANKT